MDLESADALAALRNELYGEGMELWLTHVHAPVREMLDRTGFTGSIGEGGSYPLVCDGVNAYQGREP